MSPGKYSLRIVANDRATGEKAILRGYFVVPKPDSATREGTSCGVTVVNSSSEREGSRVKVQFSGTGAARRFVCRVDRGENQTCESLIIYCYVH